MNERTNRITWDAMYFKIAEIVALRSADPHTQVGCVLVSPTKQILGIGYNGAPRDFKGNFNWKTEEKYLYVIHAEMNAIANACAIGANVVGASIYLTLSPCHECMKLIVQHRIAEINFIDTYKDFDESLKIAKACGIQMYQYSEKDKNGLVKDRRIIWN